MPNGEVNNLIKEPGIQILFSLLKKGGKKEKKKRKQKEHWSDLSLHKTESWKVFKTAL